MPATIAIFSRALTTETTSRPKSHMIHQVIKGARNLQRENYALLKQNENRFLCVFRDWFVNNLNGFFACHGCKPGLHFFPSCSMVNSKGYSEFDIRACLQRCPLFQYYNQPSHHASRVCRIHCTDHCIFQWHGIK